MKIINEQAIHEFHRSKAEKEYQEKVEQHLEELKRQRDVAINELDSRADYMEREYPDKKASFSGVPAKLLIALIVIVWIILFMTPPVIRTLDDSAVGSILFLAVPVILIILIIKKSDKSVEGVYDNNNSIADKKIQLREEISKRYLDHCEKIKNGDYPQLQRIHTELFRKAEQDAEEEIARLKEENLKEEAEADASPVTSDLEKAAARFRDRILLSDVSFDPIIDDVVARLCRARDTMVPDPDKEFYEIVVDIDVKTKGIYYSVPKEAKESSAPNGYLFSFFDHRYQDLGEDAQRMGFAMVLQQYIDERLPEIFSENDLRKNWETKKDWMRLRLQYLNPDFNQLQGWD